MLIVAGLILLALGVLSGAYLLLVPFGVVAGEAGLALWVLFPVFSILGYLLAAAPARDSSLPLLTRGAGVVLLLLALLAAVGIVLDSTAILPARGDLASVWYVLVIGLVLGATGVATHRPRGKAAA
ncbi:hypothetical protein BWI17_16700 [Betaproteobacteria bacterium GR16-43]|nr:hypothetical protein BWI17_16700 [Betaproteobacteria bacterium GR16-43]